MKIGGVGHNDVTGLRINYDHAVFPLSRIQCRQQRFAGVQTIRIGLARLK
jgi:hypothetical protein